jgi:hypothetical protein
LPSTPAGALQMVTYHHGDVSEHGQTTRQKRRNDQFHDLKSLQGCQRAGSVLIRYSTFVKSTTFFRSVTLL